MSHYVLPFVLLLVADLRAVLCRTDKCYVYIFRINDVQLWLKFEIIPMSYCIHASGLAKGAQGSQSPILQIKHKHTFKLHEIF